MGWDGGEMRVDIRVYLTPCSCIDTVLKFWSCSLPSLRLFFCSGICAVMSQEPNQRASGSN